MTVIIDYGVGNLFSLMSSFKKIGEKTLISSSESDLESADRIILPGVGAFGDASKKLQDSGLVLPLKKQVDNGKPVMGVCLGMQLLFTKSHEYGIHPGLDLLQGEIVPISSLVSGLKVPHMGWNYLKFPKGKHPLFKYISENDYVYFVHSYCAVSCHDSIIATTEYGAEITAAAANRNVIGCQFHPEKSGETGLKILKAFCEMKEGSLC